jgi:hypothetical protein
VRSGLKSFTAKFQRKETGQIKKLIEIYLCGYNKTDEETVYVLDGTRVECIVNFPNGKNGLLSLIEKINNKSFGLTYGISILISSANII